MADYTVVDNQNGTATVSGIEGSDTLLGVNRLQFADQYRDLLIPGITLIGTSSADQLNGTENNDTISGADGNDTLLGGEGADTLSGDAGDDVVYGGGGNDTIVGGSGQGNDTYLGGAGIDTVRFTSAAAAIIVDLSTGRATSLGGGDQAGIGDDSLSEIENVIAGHFDDIIVGDIRNNRLDGRDGSDQMFGGAGDDTYVVESTGDLVFEQIDNGVDTVESAISYYLLANVERLVLTSASGNSYGVGNDLVNSLDGNAGNNLLIAGGGDDVVNGEAGADAIFGEQGADVLNGNEGIDYLAGGSGNDVLAGGENADALHGEDGNDLLIGGSTFDTDIMTGGAGNDVLRGDSGLADYDLMDGGAGDDVYWVDTGDDLTFEAVGGGIDTVHADVKVISAGVYLYANVENLVLEGTTSFGVGNELGNELTGSAGGNWLLGGFGNDLINGKEGNDVLFGEVGADTFIFEAGTGADVIGDFEAGVDKISLVGYGLDFAQVQGLFVQVGDVGAIQMTNGDMIVLHNTLMLNITSSDFIFG